MTDKHSIEDCTRVFVSWSWLAGIVVGLIGCGAGIAWASATKITKVENRVEVIETTNKSMDSKLDTLIARTR
jgi:hypothetical protein